MIRIGLCGFGTVGQSLVRHLLDHKKIISKKISSEYEIIYIADRSIDKKNYPKHIKVTKNIMDLANPDKVDILVELIGDENKTYPLIKQAIKNKINNNIVTANKALIANKGSEIFDLVKKHNVFWF